MRVGLLLGVYNDNYSLSFLSCISKEVKARNAHLIVFEGYSLENSTVEDYSCNTVFRLITRERLDGLIILASPLYLNTGKGMVEDLCKKICVPVVVLGVAIDGIASVVLDNSAGFNAMVSHLIDHSYRKFALIGGPSCNPESVLRKKSFISTLASNGLCVPEKFMLEGNFTYISGYNHALKLIDAIRNKEIDAVVSANDEMAFGAIRCFSDNSVKVPQDVAVTGFDNSAMSMFFSPPVTTVSQRYEAMSKKAVTALFEQMFSRKSIQAHMLEPELVIRASCGCSHKAEIGKEHAYPFVSSYRLNGKLQLLGLDDLFNYLAEYLEDNSIKDCYVVCYPEPFNFHDAKYAKQALKGQVFFGYSQGRRIFYPKNFNVTDILPNPLMDQIHEPMLVKPLFFGKSQYGYLYISAYDTMASFIDDLSLELSHYLESLNMANERKAAEKRLTEAHESLMLSNKKLNELTVKENLDKLNNIRYLASNMLQHRKSSSGDFVLIIVEIDDFKEINMKYGFNEGEYVISCVSSILANSIREDDFLSHQSCEQYVILIKNAQNDPIKTIEDRFMQRLEALNQYQKKPYRIGFTWGSAHATVDQDFEEVYKKAELNLLEKKQSRVQIM